MKPMLSCREVTRLVSERQDRRLGLGQRVALRLHFVICQGCSNFSRQMDFLREAMKRLGEPESSTDS